LRCSRLRAHPSRRPPPEQSEASSTSARRCRCEWFSGGCRAIRRLACASAPHEEDNATLTACGYPAKRVPGPLSRHVVKYTPWSTEVLQKEAARVVRSLILLVSG
ncbi:hypothetical protein ALC62_08236, partial [Cyphomyrmex costatus]